MATITRNDNWTYAALRRPTVLLMLGALLVGHTLLALPLPTFWAGVGAWFVLGLPGALLAQVLFSDEQDPLLTMLLGLCGALAGASLLLLALQALPGPLPWWLPLLLADVLSLLVLRVCAGQPLPAANASYLSLWRLNLLVLALILLLGAALRLPQLNSSEFQGDEARALLMAVGLQYGQDDVLLVHKKGPVEILLPAAPLVLSGRVNEGAARLPFALAGIGVLLGAFLVARQLFAAGEHAATGIIAGLVAAAVLALDGFMIAFSRIVQYQSVLVLMSLGAVWCCWRFYEGGPRPRRDLCVAAALAAVGLLAHYDGIYVLPALVWLVLAGAWRRRWSLNQWLRGLGLPLLVGLALLLSFYLPFALHERFARTLGYLNERTGQEAQLVSMLYNNLIRYYRLATFYNTTFQMVSLGLALLAGGICWTAIYVRPRLLGWLLALGLLVGAVILYQQPDRFQFAEGDEGGSWAIVPFLLPIVALALSPATPLALRILTIWFGGAFIAHSFLIVKPQTHFYTMNVPAALLIGLAVARLCAWFRTQRLGLLQVPLAAGGVALALLAIPYMYIVYVRQWPPYQLVFPKARPDIYRASYDDSLPQRGGYFGFPHGSGWKVVGDLYDRGLLHGDYSSNEEELVTGWYTRGAFRCDSKPNYYFVALRPRDRQKIPADMINSQYHVFGYVEHHGEQILIIYSRDPVGPIQVFHIDDYADTFDSTQIQNFPLQRSLFEILPQHQLNANWQRGLVLRGFDLEQPVLRPGLRATLSLYWQATEPLGTGFELNILVLDAAGKQVATARNHCGVVPLERWNNHRVVGTAFTFTPDPSLPSGSYTLRAELRNPQSGEVLPLAGGANGLDFATVQVVGEERQGASLPPERSMR